MSGAPRSRSSLREPWHREAARGRRRRRIRRRVHRAHLERGARCCPGRRNRRPRRARRPARDGGRARRPGRGGRRGARRARPSRVGALRSPPGMRRWRRSRPDDSVRRWRLAVDVNLNGPPTACIISSAHGGRWRTATSRPAPPYAVLRPRHTRRRSSRSRFDGRSPRSRDANCIRTDMHLDGRVRCDAAAHFDRSWFEDAVIMTDASGSRARISPTRARSSRWAARAGIVLPTRAAARRAARLAVRLRRDPARRIGAPSRSSSSSAAIARRCSRSCARAFRPPLGKESVWSPSSCITNHVRTYHTQEMSADRVWSAGRPDLTIVEAGAGKAEHGEAQPGGAGPARVVVCDSFRGMPPNDEAHERVGPPVTFRESVSNAVDGATDGGAFRALEACTFVKGWFAETLPRLEGPVDVCSTSISWNRRAPASAGSTAAARVRGALHRTDICRRRSLLPTRFLATRSASAAHDRASRAHEAARDPRVMLPKNWGRLLEPPVESILEPSRRRARRDDSWPVRRRRRRDRACRSRDREPARADAVTHSSSATVPQGARRDPACTCRCRSSRCARRPRYGSSDCPSRSSRPRRPWSCRAGSASPC